MRTAGTRPAGLDRADRAFAEALFERLASDGARSPGISRDAYGPTESQALDLIATMALEGGLQVTRDAAANLVVTLEGSEPDRPCVACGSHIDSVPHGGNFDGSAGVVAGLVSLQAIRRSKIVPRRTLRMIAFRGEESALFGRACLGSRALLGQLGSADLEARHAHTGEPLRQLLLALGADLALIERSVPLMDLAMLGAWIELHIEQGPVLVERGAPVGVVTSLRGNLRHRRVVCLGEAGHSGAVPQALRRDAVFATAALLNRMETLCERVLARGEDLVVTCGEIGTDPAHHAINCIPGVVGFSMDVRSESLATLENYYESIRGEALAIERERTVAFVWDERIDVSPVQLDRALSDTITKTLGGFGLAEERLPSGAGHDTASFVSAGIPSAMLFVRNRNGSHNPQEAMAMDDFMIGATILHAILEDASACV